MRRINFNSTIQRLLHAWRHWKQDFELTSFSYRIADSKRMPIFYLMYSAMHKQIRFNQKPLIVLLLISLAVSELNAFGNEDALGTFMIKSPESTDAPPGDEVQLQCELNLPPEKLEFRFRPQGSGSEERDRLINIHKMVINSYREALKRRLTKPTIIFYSLATI